MLQASRGVLPDRLGWVDGIMAWTAPKIQAMLLKVAPAKTPTILRPQTGKMQSLHAPSPRQFSAESQSSYGRK